MGAVLIISVAGVIFDGGAPVALTRSTFDFPRSAFAEDNVGLLEISVLPLQGP